MFPLDWKQSPSQACRHASVPTCGLTASRRVQIRLLCSFIGDPSLLALGLQDVVPTPRSGTRDTPGLPARLPSLARRRSGTPELPCPAAPAHLSSQHGSHGVDAFGLVPPLPSHSLSSPDHDLRTFIHPASSPVPGTFNVVKWKLVPRSF